MATSTPNCPDRTALYLRSIQDSYREENTFKKATPNVLTEVFPINAFRVLVSFSIVPTTTAKVFFRTGNGALILYHQDTIPFNVTVTQPLHFTLPTYEWLVLDTGTTPIIAIGIVKQ